MSTSDGQDRRAGDTDGTGRRIGAYRLIREIGHGGMGAVYLAVRDDDAFQKRVAIKVLKRGMDTDAIVRRFRHERQILAGLEHPYIAGLLDGGTTPDGLPYFAMEYVEGRSILEYCDAHHLDTTARLKLFRKVCDAVQHAHRNLIVHRDIKPANVLVTAEGLPKLLDFGIAKLLNPELAGHTLAPTLAGLQLMTPEYASPEQVRGEPVTTATDVYSLGVLLYELLTGRRPYRLTGRTPEAIARVVCEATPVRPSTAVTTGRVEAAASEAETDLGVTGQAEMVAPGPAANGRETSGAADTERLRRRLVGDLDTIILKALSKEPVRRFASVDQFSEDVRRHLAGLPVLARGDTFGYRAAKFVQRNRVAIVAGLLVFGTLVAAVVGTSWQASVARAERARAEQRFADLRSLANTFIFELHDAISDLPGSTPARQLLVSEGLRYLDKLAADAGDQPDLMRELAAAYLKVGDVQGRPLNPNLGDTPGALESYRKATGIYEALRAGGVAHPALADDLATSYLRQSDVLASMGETAQALAFAEEALALQESADGTRSAGLRLELAASYSRVGDLLSATGDTTGALARRREALALAERAAAAAPNNVEAIRQLAVSHQKLANSLGNPNYPNVGDPEGALDEIERAAGVLRQASDAYPTNALFRRLLAVVDSNAADLLGALERPDEAFARQQQALSAFEALAAADPANVAAHNDVAISLSKIAELVDAAGRSQEALEHYERALAIHERLVAADPENATLKLDVASDYNRLATTQARIGNREAALANHSLAVAMSRELSAGNPENVELRVAVSLALLGRGDAYAQFGRAAPAGERADDLTAAERDYVEAVNVLGRLQAEGGIQGSDVATLEAARRELERIRRDRS